MIKYQDIIDNYIDHLNKLKQFDFSIFDEVYQIIEKSNVVWTTGIGKAGLAAKKLSSSLSCSNISSSFIHPAEALHGDLGAINQNDCLIAFSNSGKTYEVLKVIEKSKQNLLGSDYKVIFITSNKVNIKNIDILFNYGNVKESCILGLMPTTSTMIMNTISDIISINIQDKVNMNYEKYSIIHHSGYLGEISKEKAKNEQIN